MSKIGVIGGSGLYQLGEKFPCKPIQVETPYGSPTSDLFHTLCGENELFFIARHGEGHVFTPTEVNYRANIFALKKMGVNTVISVSAVGSLRKEIHPGDFVLPDQYVDLTKGLRAHSFFGNGVVAHAHFADPACRTLRDHIAKTAERLGIKTHRGGTYICIEGPHFSTRAESHWYRSWNLPSGPINVIGMTAMPEARLAREAGLCYQTVAMATDYDCWNEEAGDVSVEAIVKLLHQNVETSRKLIGDLGAHKFEACKVGCDQMMKHAVMTAPAKITEARRNDLGILLQP